MDQIYLSLPEYMYSFCTPLDFENAKLIHYNSELASLYGLPVKQKKVSEMMHHWLRNTNQKTVALAYAGHQFGHYSPQLGDGRAHLIGQFPTPNGEILDIQLKGSGRTKYSRNGDGFATLGAVIREYLISEALAGLNIPTTRTLGIIGTGQEIYRDYAYVPGAIQIRTAKSHLRVGSFEFAFQRGGISGVQRLADHFIAYHFPEFKDSPHQYLQMFESVALQQADLIAQWMLVGFIHGVMNTDNMALSGESIDFGPCAFLDVFNANKKFSAIDQHGRYAWGQQGQIGLWNLQRFAETLLPLFSENKDQSLSLANDVLSHYADRFEMQLHHGFLHKLALDASKNTDKFIRDTLEMMTFEEIDFTLFFTELTLIAETSLKNNGLIENPSFESLFHSKERAKDWQEQWFKMVSLNHKKIKLMKGANPKINARNHLVEKAIQQTTANGDFSFFKEFASVLKDPYGTSIPNEFKQAPRPEQVILRTFCGT